MSEPLRKQDAALRDKPLEPDVLSRGALRDLLPEVRPAQTNDNETAPSHREGERAGFQVPASIWRAMVICYALFLSALLAATGGAHAAFAIAVSAIYVAMFFGTARMMLRHQPKQSASPLERPGGKLATLSGPLGYKEVAAQMLVVPCAVVLFGVAVLIIRLAVG